MASRNSNSSQGALLITPRSLDLIEDLTCPICREPYSGVDGSDTRPECEQEEPVSVDMVAEWFGSRRCCGHIMGRSCLKRHLSSSGAWKNKCPLCRNVWFYNNPPSSAREGEQQSEETPFRSPTVPALRRSTRIANRTAAWRGSSPRSSMGYRSGITQTQRQVRPQLRPPRFTWQLLAALEVTDGSVEIKHTKEDVEEILEAFYRNLGAS